jgi:hypothetical protein
MIEDLAAFLVDRGLAVPSIFILEMQKPLCGLLRAGGTSILPIIGSLLGRARCENVLALFGSAAQVEALISTIEAREQARRSARA